ncbi:MAG: UDP-N-acetylmuramate dehydrogenase [Ruminococcus sp.]|nr:UDP-N-acetylmuramate dehydrogenase [Ruminococcus sp.]MDY2743890.1 UDP-N-acetylmuramate dehydrogenase [Eubacteriales bacterium]
MITRHNEPLAKYSSFRTGGKAANIIFPESTEEFVTALRENPGAAVLGNLSNTLVLDGGIDGTVIITTKLNSVSVNGNTVTAAAGASLTSVAVAARDASLAGCEFLYGIPGTVGGGVFMNAGAYGGEIADIIENAVVFTPDGKVTTLSKDDLDLGYRTSKLQSTRYILLSAAFSLQSGNKEVISSAMDDLMNRRMTTQPLDKPSCGSTFKRPAGNFAGKLISDCGLKGMSVGGAQVSEKHAGFIVNSGGATSRDILDLVQLVKKTVFEKTGVLLEEEIRIIGRE